MQQSETDLELIELANHGDATAFERLYLRYRDRIFRMALRFCGDEQEAADVLQEAFIYFLGKFPGFVLTSRLTTFLFPAVRNIALAKKRKLKRIKLMDEMPDAPAPEGSAASCPDIDSEWQFILQGLSDAHREVVLLRFVDDMSMQEIGDTLGIPVGTVKSRLHNAIGQLRKDERVRHYFEA